MRPTVLIFSFFVAAGCASAGGLRTASTPSHDANRVTAEELAQLQGGNLYEVLASQRPWLLNGRGAPLSVFVNGRHVDGVEILKGLAPNDVASVVRVASSEGRIAGDFGDGPALYVILRRR